MDGGIVSEILVREGQVVKMGDLLLKVDPNTNGVLAARKPIAISGPVGESHAFAGFVRWFPIQSTGRSRQRSTRDRGAGTGAFRSPSIRAGSRYWRCSPTIIATGPRTHLRQGAPRASRAEFHTDGKRARNDAALAKTGAVSDVELLRLERDVARYRGERDSANSDIPRLESAVAEAKPEDAGG